MTRISAPAALVRATAFRSSTPPGPREAEFSDRRGYASCVCRRWIDQDVEVLRESRPAVRGQSVRADEQEPDAMALQCVQKLVPFG
jgi:hypothetical protein